MSRRDKIQKSITIAAILCETSHVFCCVLPTLFSVLSLLVGLGFIAVMPGWMDGLHGALHAYELPIIAGSALVIALGWALHFYAEKIDCHDTGCGHGPCEPQKRKVSKVLKIATFLFFINIVVYFSFHYNMSQNIAPAAVEHIH